MKKRKFLSICLAGTLVLTGCGSSGTQQSQGGTETAAAESAEDAAESGSGSAGTETAGTDGSVNTEGVDLSELFTDNDMEIGYDRENSVVIELLGTEVSCSSDAVTVEGTSVTIRDEGTYILTGSLEDGMIIVDADDTDKVRIVLDQADIYCSDSAAVYVRSADKVFLTTANGTENSLSNSGTYEELDENKIDAVIFSKDDLTLNGAGSLTVESPGGHGVVSKDDLVLTSGTYEIAASSHGLSGKDSVRISGGEYCIDSGKDGIQAENDEDSSLGYVYISGGTFEITSGGDGISAGSWFQADGGEFTIEAGGGSANGETHAAEGGAGQRGPGRFQAPAGGGPADGGIKEEGGDLTDGGPAKPEGNMDAGETGSSQASEETASMKGIKAAVSLIVNGGTYDIDAADDAFHSNGLLTIAGGDLKAASGDDAIHGDGAVTIQGGTVNITESYEGIEGLTVEIAGGEISLVSDDDGINAAGGNDESGFGGRGGDMFAAEEGVCITISGGTLSICASGDGIDSNGDFYVTGGVTYVSGPSDGGNGAIDYNGEASITGGIFAAAGSGRMESGFGSSSGQGVIMVNVDTQEAGTAAALLGEDGGELISWVPEHSYGFLLFSCPEITEGNTYTVTAGSTETEIVMDGLIYGSASGMGGMNGGRKEQGGRNRTEDANGRNGL